MKKVIWILIIIILLAVGYFYFFGNKKDTQNMSNNSVPSQVTASNTEDTASGTKPLITLAEIATHNTKADCWTTIEGKVYNMTSFIPSHPGGDKILVVCGKDGTQAFMNQHNNGQMQLNILSQLYIGDLATN